MKRRRFIKNSSVIAAASLTLPSVVLKERNQRVKCITILHTNDTHSNIDPFPENHAKYPGMGGVEKRFELIQQIRSEQEHVILLDAGDIFQGTPYFNKYGGILEMKLMTALGYDVGTMGNHDFDGGLEGFAKARAYADFPFVCGNYDFKNTCLRMQYVLQKEHKTWHPDWFELPCQPQHLRRTFQLSTQTSLLHHPCV